MDSVRLALRPVRSRYGRTPATDFGPTALKAVRQVMIDEKLVRVTINQRVKRIVRVFGWAGEAEMIPPSFQHASKAGGKEGRRSTRSPTPGWTPCGPTSPARSAA